MSTQESSSASSSSSSQRRFLNVQFNRKTASLDISGYERFTQLQKEIYSHYGIITCPAAEIQLRDDQGHEFDDLDEIKNDLPIEYFVPLKKGGKALRIDAPEPTATVNGRSTSLNVF